MRNPPSPFLAFVLLCLLPLAAGIEYRSLDGTGNNKNHPLWGSGNITFLRGNGTATYGLHYADASGTPQGLVSPRVLSNKLFGLHPEVKSSFPITAMHIYWGQFFDHDVTRTPMNASDAIEISVPSNDPVMAQFGSSMPFSRSSYMTIDGNREQYNLNSAWVDGSQVYGMDQAIADSIRDGCKLKMRQTNVGPLLELNSVKLDMENEARVVATERLHIAGDRRANENPGLLALHTVLALEHNRLCEKFAGENPTWDQYTLYQEARRWTIAFIQRISFEEYLPATIGRSLPPYTGYRPDINPGIDNLFATATFRYGHTEVVDHLARLDEDRSKTIALGNLTLVSCFHNPTCLESAGIEHILRGMAAQLQNNIDPFYINELRNFLFGNPSAPLGGLDLAARNILRGRDHGLPSYNQARVYLGLKAVRSFEEISENREIVNALREVYQNDVNKVEAYVGSLAEDPIDDITPMGPLLRASLEEQYIRLRDGDRFYFETADAGFTEGQKNQIKRTRLADLILRNTNVSSLQCAVFFSSKELNCLKDDHTPKPPSSLPTYTDHVSLMGGDFLAQWTVDYDLEEISFNFTVQTKGWVGFGIGISPNQMLGADVVTGWVDDATRQVYVQDRSLTARQEGCPGSCEDLKMQGTSDVRKQWGEQTNEGVTMIGWTRKWNTGDTVADLVINRGSVYIVAAYGSADRVSYHGQNKASREVELIPLSPPVPVAPPKAPTSLPKAPVSPPTSPPKAPPTASPTSSPAPTPKASPSPAKAPQSATLTPTAPVASPKGAPAPASKPSPPRSPAIPFQVSTASTATPLRLWSTLPGFWLAWRLVEFLDLV